MTEQLECTQVAGVEAREREHTGNVWVQASALCLVLLVGCGQLFIETVDTGTAADAGARDAGTTDAGMIDGTASDTPSDTPEDIAMLDVNPDVGIDADSDGGAFLPAAIAVYYLSEGASGQGPTQLLDSAPDPLHMPVHCVSSSPVFGEGAMGRFLRFDGVPDQDTGGGLVNIEGTKIVALHGSQVATLETVAAKRCANASLASVMATHRRMAG